MDVSFFLRDGDVFFRLVKQNTGCSAVPTVSEYLAEPSHKKMYPGHWKAFEEEQNLVREMNEASKPSGVLSEAKIRKISKKI